MVDGVTDALADGYWDWDGVLRGELDGEAESDGDPVGSGMGFPQM